MSLSIETLSAFQALVVFNVTNESQELEFKASIDGIGKNVPDRKRKEAQLELCRDISQFANTGGGCLLIGISENKGIAKSIEPLEEPNVVRDWIDRAVTNYLSPSTLSYRTVEIPTDAGSILAINIPPSRHLIAVWDHQAHTIEYLVRNQHGKEWLNPDEAERRLMDGSRAAKIALVTAKRAATSRRVDLVGCLFNRFSNGSSQPISAKSSSVNITLTEIEDYTFTLNISVGRNTYDVSVPYGFIRETWVKPVLAERWVALMLNVNLVIPANKDQGEIEIQPV